MGPIKPLAKNTHAEYIIVAIDYLTKWVEAKATVIETMQGLQPNSSMRTSSQDLGFLLRL